ncbi:hypothetical protein [Lactococcus petauri]|uniref:hypothetical protein n=1 Tax=Lactococcus petauri TaxID=1940789 RepID=UPI002550F30A|nr:hypothetical protein [Lactococcus petauri]
MSLEKLVLSNPSNIKVIENSMARWESAKVRVMQCSEITHRGKNSSGGRRWKIVDGDGKLLDNAQGYGFKGPYNAQRVIDYMNG